MIEYTNHDIQRLITALGNQEGCVCWLQWMSDGTAFVVAKRSTDTDEVLARGMTLAQTVEWLAEATGEPLPERPAFTLEELEARFMDAVARMKNERFWRHKVFPPGHTLHQAKQEDMRLLIADVVWMKDQLKQYAVRPMEQPPLLEIKSNSYAR